VQQFFSLKFQIPTGMPTKNVTVGDKIALLEKIKYQLPNTRHHQLVQKTAVPKSTTARFTQ
jgi:phospholipid N-methyltransferase